MDNADRKELLSLLVDLQQNCAPIELSIGKAIDGRCNDNFVVIKKAPPKIVKELIDRGYNLDITTEGATVWKF